MLFNSISFLCFFPVVVGIYFLVPKKARYLWLLFASYYFYMSWNAKYALLLLFSTVLTYSCARLIEKAESAKSRKAFLILCLVLQLGILFGMKYLNFAVSLLARLLLLLHVELTVPAFDIVLPVGISFYTFQTVSYIIDCHWEKVKPQRSLKNFLLYITLFPQLVAGPIVRYSTIEKEIESRSFFNWIRRSR